jgi:hypothetical protein
VLPGEPGLAVHGLRKFLDLRTEQRSQRRRIEIVERYVAPQQFRIVEVARELRPQAQRRIGHRLRHGHVDLVQVKTLAHQQIERIDDLPGRVRQAQHDAHVRQLQQLQLLKKLRPQDVAARFDAGQPDTLIRPARQLDLGVDQRHRPGHRREPEQRSQQVDIDAEVACLDHDLTRRIEQLDVLQADHRRQPAPFTLEAPDLEIEVHVRPDLGQDLLLIPPELRHVVAPQRDHGGHDHQGEQCCGPENAPDDTGESQPHGVRAG